MEQELANSLFPVYLSLQVIHKDKAFLQKRSVITQHKSTSLKLIDFKEFYAFEGLSTHSHNVWVLFFPRLEIY